MIFYSINNNSLLSLFDIFFDSLIEMIIQTLEFETMWMIIRTTKLVYMIHDKY
jgi:hypothetical protein